MSNSPYVNLVVSLIVYHLSYRVSLSILLHDAEQGFIRKGHYHQKSTRLTPYQCQNQTTREGETALIFAIFLSVSILS